MRDDHEDAPPCAEVELSTERPDTLPPDTDREFSLADVMAALGKYQASVDLLLATTEIHEIQREVRLSRIDGNVLAVRNDLGHQLSGVATLLDEKMTVLLVEIDRKLDSATDKLASLIGTMTHVATSALDAGTKAHEKAIVLEERLYDLEVGKLRDERDEEIEGARAAGGR